MRVDAIGVLALAGLLTAAPALAQTPALSLTLDEAIARAMDASHRLAEIRAREEGARAAADGRRAAGQPTVAVHAGYTRTNHVDEFGVPLPDGRLRVIFPDIPDNVATRLSFQWPIYTAGRIDALERAARAEAGAVAADLAAARLDLRLEVERAYWALATATETVRVLDEALARADAHLSAARAHVDAGFAPPNEALSAEAHRSRQELLSIEARNQRESAALVLRRLIGAPPDQPIVLADRLEPPPSALVPPRASSLGPQASDPAPQASSLVPPRASGPGPRASDLGPQALQSGPQASAGAERQGLLLRLEGASERQLAAAAGRRPVVFLNGGVDYARPNPRIFPRQDIWQESWDVSVNLTWTLWDGGRTAADRAEAAAGVRALTARLADFDEQVDAEIRQRELEVASALAAIRAADDGVRAAAEARRVLGERFDAGVATSTEVLDAQAALLEAELARTRAAATLRLAEARLARARER